MHVVAAVIHKSVYAHGIWNATVPVAEELRVFWILLEVVNHDALHALHLSAVSYEYARA